MGIIYSCDFGLEGASQEHPEYCIDALQNGIKWVPLSDVVSSPVRGAAGADRPYLAWSRDGISRTIMDLKARPSPMVLQARPSPLTLQARPSPLALQARPRPLTLQATPTPLTLRAKPSPLAVQWEMRRFTLLLAIAVYLTVPRLFHTLPDTTKWLGERS